MARRRLCALLTVAGSLAFATAPAGAADDAWNSRGLRTAITVDRLMEARRFTTLRVTDLARLRVPLKKVLPVVEAPDHNPRLAGLDDENLRARFAPPPEQLDLFANAVPEASVLSGEL